MKIIIYDASNDGILYITDSVLKANYLKKGLLDTDTVTLTLLNTKLDSYKLISDITTIPDNYHYFYSRRGGEIKVLPESALNAAYLNRRALVKLRAPALDRIYNHISLLTPRFQFSVDDGFENSLQAELDQCDPENSTWSHNLVEYATINQISPLAAYKEIKLQVESIQNYKIKMYAWSVYLVERLGNIQTEQDRADLFDFMDNRLWRDNFI